MAYRKKHFVAQLSGGHQQRVLVARALVTDPADPLGRGPTGNLDSKNGETVIEFLSELHAQWATICMVTHDARYEDYSDRIIHLFDGKLVNELRLQ